MGATNPDHAWDAPATVLVVDDEPALTDHLVMAAEALGYVAHSARSAEEAFTKLVAHPETLVVISDVRMPKEDGFSFAARVMAARPEEHALEFVMITGHLSLDAATTALRVGAADFLQKPFRLSELGEALMRAATRARQRRDAERARQAMATELRHSEQARLDLAGRLAGVVERLAHGAPGGQPPLSSAERMAVSHALRTPLNALSGAIMLMENTGEKPQDEATGGLLRHGLDQAVDAVERLEELQQVAVWPSAGAPEPCDLAALLAHEVARLPLAGRAIRVGAMQGDGPMILRVCPDATRRALRLGLEALLMWREGGGLLETFAEPAATRGDRWNCLTLVLREEGNRAPIPRAPCFAAEGSPHSRTIECIRFLIARRLVAPDRGELTAWTSGREVAALRLAYPAPG